MKVVIESGPIEDRRFYHLRATLVCKNKSGVPLAEIVQDFEQKLEESRKEAGENFFKLLDSNLDLLEEIDEQDLKCSLKADLRSIDGVYYVGHDDKMILIEKSPAYSWSEIEDQVLVVVANHLEISSLEFDIERQTSTPVGDPRLN